MFLLHMYLRSPSFYTTTEPDRSGQSGPKLLHCLFKWDVERGVLHILWEWCGVAPRAEAPATFPATQK